MVDVAAARTAKALKMTRLGIDGATRGAGLRTVRRGNFDQVATAPGELVAQELDQAAPARVSNSTRERTVLQHVGGLKALDDDRAVALGVGGGERMQDVVALAANLAMQPVHAAHGFFDCRSFLSPPLPLRVRTDIGGTSRERNLSTECFQLADLIKAFGEASGRPDLAFAARREIQRNASAHPRPATLCCFGW